MVVAGHGNASGRCDDTATAARSAWFTLHERSHRFNPPYRRLLHDVGIQHKDAAELKSRTTRRNRVNGSEATSCIRQTGASSFNTFTAHATTTAGNCERHQGEARSTSTTCHHRVALPGHATTAYSGGEHIDLLARSIVFEIDHQTTEPRSAGPYHHHGSLSPRWRRRRKRLSEEAEGLRRQYGWTTCARCTRRCAVFGEATW